MAVVLGVVGSPRARGNTHVLVEQVLEGARAAGAETRLIMLGDLSIGECDGCHLCWQGRRCPKNDDMVGLYPQIIGSDAIVFGTPVYWYGPTALMKAFIDRFVYFNCPENRVKIAGKAAAIAVPFEDTDPETVQPVEQFFEKSLAYLEMKLAGKVIAPGVTERGEVREKPDLLDEALGLGRRLAGVRSSHDEA